MIKKVYSAVVLLTLVTPVAAFAVEEAADVHGLIELGVRGVSSTSSDGAAFQEFRDMSDGVMGQVQLDAFKGNYHFQLDTENPGTDDQSFQVKGGEYGSFKYKFNYSEMLHNYGFDAVSPATGIGTSHLIIPTAAAAAALPVSQWTKFDYSVNHKTYGGELELSLNSPFYVKAGVERREQNGLRPYSFYLGQMASANRGIAEVPEPISTTTDNLNLKVGYVGETISTSLSGTLSSFTNDNKFMDYANSWGNGTTQGIDRTDAFSPDNDYGKLAADLSWRDLPLASVLAVGASYSHMKSSIAASEVNATAATWTLFNTLNRTTFEGDTNYTSASVSLASNPVDKLDSKVYYRYLKKDNNSSLISYNSGATSNADLLASYQKDDVGIDLGYRLPNKTKLEAGYEYLNMDRSTLEGAGIPADSTKDNSVYVGLKNSALDWMTAKIRYKHLKRNSDDLGTPTTFYYQDQSSDEWKVGFDFYPTETLDWGLSFAYKDINYEASTDTIQNDKRKNVYLDATWHASTMVTLTGFVGYETTKNDANRIALAVPADTSAATTTPYVLSNDDNFWTYGLAANLAATEKLTFNLAWQYQKSNGQVDFSEPTFPSNTESDDYTKNTLEAKAIYAIDPKLKMTVGYMYEKFKYQDVNYTNYSYQPVAANQGFYSGLNADPNYEANVGYLLVSYGF